MGGMGKSALAWEWFRQVVGDHSSRFGGSMWWSFYESDAHYENFVIRALAYLRGQSQDDIVKLAILKRESLLLEMLGAEGNAEEAEEKLR